MALPEVEETTHFRFHVPIWKVRGKTFLGMAKNEMAAVFCISEQEADEASAADPATFAAVRRQDTRHSFLGLQVELGSVTAERIRDLAGQAWRCQAPKALVAQERGSSASRPGLFLVSGRASRGR
jgi:hypothetical protein